MQTVFLLCLGLGGVVLILQVVLSLLGMDGSGGADFDVPDADVPHGDIPHGDVAHGHAVFHDPGTSAAVAGLDLLSVRSLSAAFALFGAVGIWLDVYLPGALAAVLALVPAFGAAWVTAWLTRLMLRAESSGSLELEGAVGALATVYIPVPGAEAGTGVVQFPLQGRTIELRARTPDEAPIPSGTKVLVISVDPDSETVEVVSTTTIEGLES